MLLPVVLLLTITTLLLLTVLRSVLLRIDCVCNGGDGGDGGGGDDDTPNTHYRHRSRVFAVPVTDQRAHLESPEITTSPDVYTRVYITHRHTGTHVANAIREDR